MTRQQTPLISVLVPTFNGGRFLRATLDSILEQTFTDFELIIVDDQSFDETVSIATSYSNQDSRVKVIRNEENLGLVENWNQCVNLAAGEWIKFVFQDDLLAPDCLEKLIGASTPEIPLVFCFRRFIFDEGTPQETVDYYAAANQLIKNLYPDDSPVSATRFRSLVLANLEKNIIGEPTAVLLHRRVFDVFGSFHPGLIVACDTEYWLRIGTNMGVKPVTEELVLFRVHSDSVSAKSLEHRDYRTNALDGVALLYVLCHGEHYRDLRRTAKSLSINLRRKLHNKATWAFNQADSADQNGSPDLMREWRDFLQHFPRLFYIPFFARMRRLAKMMHRD